MFNRAILIGRLTADPELKQTQSGISVCSFSIAVDRRFSGRDSERKTDFINITSWRQQAEFVCRYFHKGDVIGVEGSIQTRNYEDKNGNKRTATEIVTDNVFFTGRTLQQCRFGKAELMAITATLPPPPRSPPIPAALPATLRKWKAITTCPSDPNENCFIILIRRFEPWLWSVPKDPRDP